MKTFMMKMVSVAAAASFVLTVAGFAAAATTASPNDVNKLKAEISMLNADARLPQGDSIVKKQLSDNFNVKSDKLDSLISRNMNYGDAAAVLAFADKMSGGVTDANINQVLSLKQSQGGWDQIAKSLNVDVSDVASKLSSIEDDAHSGIKEAMAASPSAGAGGVGEPSGGVGSEPSEGMPGGATGGTGTEGMPGGGTGGGPETGTGGGSSGAGGGGY